MGNASQDASDGRDKGTTYFLRGKHEKEDQNRTIDWENDVPSEGDASQNICGGRELRTTYLLRRGTSFQDSSNSTEHRTIYFLNRDRRVRR